MVSVGGEVFFCFTDFNTGFYDGGELILYRDILYRDIVLQDDEKIIEVSSYRTMENKLSAPRAEQFAEYNSAN